jgi:hypothetical protein
VKLLDAEVLEGRDRVAAAIEAVAAKARGG